MIARLLLMLSAAAWAANSPTYGILLLAHGGSSKWNQQIETLAKTLDQKVPTELALGMADSDSIQKAILRLEKRGAAKLVSVPLFINSNSELMDQTRYVLGVRKDPSKVFIKAMASMEMPMGASMEAMPPSSFLKRVKTARPLVMTAALDDHPAVADILLKRARALGKNPAQETVILVGHGPVDDQANVVWLQTMASLARQIQGKAGFKSVESATIRDDSPKAAKAQAAEVLRDLVSKAGRDGDVIVIPYLISAGDIQSHIKKILKGLKYRWNGQALCPDPGIRRWVLEVSAKAAAQPNMVQYQND